MDSSMIGGVPVVSRYVRYARHAVSTDEAVELRRVDDLAHQLSAHLDQRSAQIDRVHVHGAKSMDVQTIVAELLCGTLGFGQEVVLTPQDGFVTRARPDFYYSLGAERGILAEVERGGTVNNNHDLKDLWKAHIAVDAQHLFLIVPIANWQANGNAREKPFIRVAQRLGAFFGDDRREVDVLSVHVFGYGRSIPPL
ncbi:hypothetical protein LEP48_00530 [Isoptericola sp. NEAU-Y5]|uniref:Uncharacterized protein n=1 Tax=Isoptericola luteus TaxID=2879484 RepID=A0ABS7Z9U9_9MICO|nr:hypothetical protein [Isoptericola sp. NEAU-Y5]MCA5891835.1 hypothetical protein [Isoptericola sp. NEAU-Y5]